MVNHSFFVITLFLSLLVMVKETRKKTPVKRTRYHPNIEDKMTIISYYEQLKSFKEVSKASEWSVSVCTRIIKRWIAEKSVARKRGQGDKRKTTPEQDRYIVLAVKRNRQITLEAIAKGIPGMKVSTRLVSRRINELSDLSSAWKHKCPFISNKNRIKRLAWCKERLTWTKEQWREILWSDESPFVLRYNRATRVWRTQSEKYERWAMSGTVKHDQKIMVWGCFSSLGVGNLHLIDGIMDKHQYRDILFNQMLPSARRLFGDSEWKFQEDNDPKHTSIVCKQFHVEHKTNRIDWPAQSPDLNPIENLWSILDQRCQDRSPNTKNELFACLAKEWKRLPISLLTNLVDSMPNRVAKVIERKGFSIDY
jgi:transposase